MKLQDISLTLPHKPSARLRISALFPGTSMSTSNFADSLPDITAALPPSSTLLVFLNGLILPRSSWFEAISRFLRIRDKQRRRSSTSSSYSFSSSSSSSNTGSKTGAVPEKNGSHGNTCMSATAAAGDSAYENGIHVPEIMKIPNILTYDRFGQGASDPDPSDPDPAVDDTPYGHTPEDVVDDLHQMLLLVSRQFLARDLKELDVVIVANSIGCPLARLYNGRYFPDVRVVGYLFLDSMMANSDFVSVFPDPDAPGFDPAKDLREGVDEEALRWTRKQFREKFHPSVGNPERLDRRGLRGLLPFSDKPRLRLPVDGQDQGTTREGARKRIGIPRVIVIGHDWDVFAEHNEKGPMSIPKAVINGYMNPAWQRYNEGLTRLAAVDSENVVPVKIAKGCGHFIQKDDPEMVAREVDLLLRRLGL
ncbi:hypothetical protein GE21DRAFT_3790 [Neurospora crassa]|uniref:AB hydrolase-1 domain-containing protein n=1 Tax=Neurospora crassa (strain ATCC 24698 / 74-OR23-1A / CBS 708.71 / DSM 1257 / FGSC 987) TaxID=367110 RepID=U9W7X9_NEUCR|nr:hypothetical protein NCU16606 [Neurospora crassa OR74A]ESA43115.1 hypothetical protein NCU16606 [Neurospora crassa OR74A]KHE81016.1 hypothetical protein GE21DRAFT_3790 [Neurospora crassa]|eukprot:XP_011394012.1 hypothetical protein NCU16606 [Neurospora crassa OR74A]